MRIRTDDEIYRVDAVWLGPPKATFPWRARYVAWGVGLAVFLLVLTVERRMGFGFGFFSTAWAVVITVLLTRIITAKITHERPLTAVAAMLLRELTAPRRQHSGRGGAASASSVRVRTTRPKPKSRKRPARTGQPRTGQRGTGQARAARQQPVPPRRRPGSKEARRVSPAQR